MMGTEEFERRRKALQLEMDEEASNFSSKYANRTESSFLSNFIHNTAPEFTSIQIEIEKMKLEEIAKRNHDAILRNMQNEQENEWRKSCNQEEEVRKEQSRKLDQEIGSLQLHNLKTLEANIRDQQKKDAESTKALKALEVLNKKTSESNSEWNNKIAKFQEERNQVFESIRESEVQSITTKTSTSQALKLASKLNEIKNRLKIGQGYDLRELIRKYDQNCTRLKRDILMMIDDYINNNIRLKIGSQCDIICCIEGMMQPSFEHFDLTQTLKNGPQTGEINIDILQAEGELFDFQYTIGVCNRHKKAKKFSIEEEGGMYKENKTYDKVHSIEDI